MKSLLSIVHLQTSSVSGERIAVGLLGIGDKGIFFQSSEQKLKLAAKLAAPAVAKHAELSFEFIQNKVAEANKEMKGTALLKTESAFTKEYVQYLNKYSKGLLQFDAPKSFAGELDKKSFKNLFQQFIGSWEEKEKELSEKRVPFNAILKERLKKPTFEEKADVGYKLQPEKIQGILLPHDVTLISKNGNILAAQAIDFTKSIDTISRHAYELEVICNSLENFGRERINSKHKGSYYLLFNKPEKGSAQETLLNEIQRTKARLLQIEEIAYLDSLEDKLKKGSYSKFSSFAQSLVT